MEGGDDHRPVSIGVEAQRGGRTTPTVFNAAFLSVQFWDGRAATLEDQAKRPPANPIEMGMKNLSEVIWRSWPRKRTSCSETRCSFSSASISSRRSSTGSSIMTV